MRSRNLLLELYGSVQMVLRIFVWKLTADAEFIVRSFGTLLLKCKKNVFPWKDVLGIIYVKKFAFFDSEKLMRQYLLETITRTKKSSEIISITTTPLPFHIRSFKSLMRTGTMLGLFKTVSPPLNKTSLNLPPNSNTFINDLIKWLLIFVLTLQLYPELPLLLHNIFII